MYKISSNAAVRYHEQEIRMLEAGIQRAKRITCWSWLCFGGSIASAIALANIGTVNIASLFPFLVFSLVTFSSLVAGIVTGMFIPSMICTLEQKRMMPVDERTRMIVTDGWSGRKVTYIYEP